MSNQCYNFNPGPSALPQEVRLASREAILDFRNTGIGILETSHRSDTFLQLVEECKALLAELLEIPDSHEIIFTTGGATQVFSMVALNLLSDSDSLGSYLVTGAWAKKAFLEAKRFGQAQLAASSEEANFSYIPKKIELAKNSSYLHYTSNNTIYGTQYHQTPESDDNILLLCDASSDICSMPVDFSKIDLLYAGAQKNIGCAGVTVVIARKEILELCPSSAPTLLQFKTYLSSNSLHNTPPTFSIYVLYEMLDWIKKEGGLSVMHQRAKSRAETLYNVIDSSDYFRGFANPNDRSLMNICFTLPNEELNYEFTNKAKKEGLCGLSGHRSLGGLRVSLYNGINPDATEALCSFMNEWLQKHL